MNTTRERRVLIVIGPAGSGKSTVARQIARATGSVYLDKDAQSRQLVELALTLAGHDLHSRDENEYYRTEVMPLEYRALFDVADQNLQVGNSVVLDAPFGEYYTNADYFDGIREQYGWEDVKITVVTVKVTERTARHRIEERALERDSWKLSNWEQFWRGIQSRECAWRNVERVDVRNDDASPDLSALSLDA